MWCKPWLLRRSELGVFDTLLEELRTESITDYENFIRMSEINFNDIVSKIEIDIQKQNTVMRDAIPPAVKLAVTIRFLASGTTYKDLGYQFGIHQTTLTKVIPEVCDAIYRRLSPEFMKVSLF